MKHLNTILLTAILFTACAAPKLTNNDRGLYEYSENQLDNVLAVNVSSIPIAKAAASQPEKVKTFFDLRDSIPNTFLNVIGEKAASTQEIVDAIKAPLSEVSKSSAKPSVPKEINLNEIKIRLLFSNIKKYFNSEELMHPNTRLEFLNTTLTIKSNFARIYSIDKLENEFETIDMGSLERTQNVSFSTNLSGGSSNTISNETSSGSTGSNSNESGNKKLENVYDVDGRLIGTVDVSKLENYSSSGTNNSKTTDSKTLSAKGELQYANTENIKEALQVKFKRLKTGFSFKPNQLTISQRGSPLNDISDNVFVTLTMKIDETTNIAVQRKSTNFGKLKAADGKTIALNNLTPSEQNIYYIPCHKRADIDIEISYEGAIRAVKNNRKGRNSLEFDDKVIYYRFNSPIKGETVKPETITVNDQDFCREVYKVIAYEEGTNNKYVLKRNNSEVLIYEEHAPYDFIKWLEEVIKENNPSKLQSSVNMTFETVRNPQKTLNVGSSGFSQADLDKLKKLTFGLEIRKN